MKNYIVKWKKEEKSFEDIHEAIRFAENKGETGVYVSVWTEIDGIRDDQPFFYCAWEI